MSIETPFEIKPTCVGTPCGLMMQARYSSSNTTSSGGAAGTPLARQLLGGGRGGRTRSSNASVWPGRTTLQRKCKICEIESTNGRNVAKTAARASVWPGGTILRRK